MYTSVLKTLPQNSPVFPAQNDDKLCFGLKLYKDDEVCSIDVNNTRHKWNILVFESGIYTPDMGYKDAGVYVAPFLDLQDSISLANHFKGFLLSIPFSSWRVFDIYNLESQFMSANFRPFVELDKKEVNSLGMMMSLMESSITEGKVPYNYMEGICLCRAIIASINRYFGPQSELHNVPTTGNRKVDGFLRLVEKNCLKEKKLDFYARLLGITSNYLSAAVSKTTGKKANKWISDCVIEIANKKLCSTSSKISEIAKKVGFANSTDFCKFYKAKTGVTPMQYRRYSISRAYWNNIE